MSSDSSETFQLRPSAREFVPCAPVTVTPLLSISETTTKLTKRISKSPLATINEDKAKTFNTPLVRPAKPAGTKYCDESFPLGGVDQLKLFPPSLQPRSLQPPMSSAYLKKPGLLRKEMKQAMPTSPRAVTTTDASKASSAPPGVAGAGPAKAGEVPAPAKSFPTATTTMPPAISVQYPTLSDIPQPLIDMQRVLETSHTLATSGESLDPFALPFFPPLGVPLHPPHTLIPVPLPIPIAFGPPHQHVHTHSRAAACGCPCCTGTCEAFSSPPHKYDGCDECKKSENIARTPGAAVSAPMLKRKLTPSRRGPPQKQSIPIHQRIEPILPLLNKSNFPTHLTDVDVPIYYPKTLSEVAEIVNSYVVLNAPAPDSELAKDDYLASFALVKNLNVVTQFVLALSKQWPTFREEKKVEINLIKLVLDNCWHEFNQSLLSNRYARMIHSLAFLCQICSHDAEILSKENLVHGAIQAPVDVSNYLAQHFPDLVAAKTPETPVKQKSVTKPPTPKQRSTSPKVKAKPKATKTVSIKPVLDKKPMGHKKKMSPKPAVTSAEPVKDGPPRLRSASASGSSLGSTLVITPPSVASQSSVPTTPVSSKSKRQASPPSSKTKTPLQQQSKVQLQAASVEKMKRKPQAQQTKKQPGPTQQQQQQHHHQSARQQYHQQTSGTKYQPHKQSYAEMARRSTATMPMYGGGMVLQPAATIPMPAQLHPSMQHPYHPHSHQHQHHPHQHQHQQHQQHHQRRIVGGHYKQKRNPYTPVQVGTAGASSSIAAAPINPKELNDSGYLSSSSTKTSTSTITATLPSSTVITTKPLPTENENSNLELWRKHGIFYRCDDLWKHFSKDMPKSKFVGICAERGIKTKQFFEVHTVLRKLKEQKVLKEGHFVAGLRVAGSCIEDYALLDPMVFVFVGDMLSEWVLKGFISHVGKLFEAIGHNSRLFDIVFSTLKHLNQKQPDMVAKMLGECHGDFSKVLPSALCRPKELQRLLTSLGFQDTITPR